MGLGGMDALEPASGVHSFHLRAMQRQLIQEVFKAYGVDATVDQGVRTTSIRFDLDDAPSPRPHEPFRWQPQRSMCRSMPTERWWRPTRAKTVASLPAMEKRRSIWRGCNDRDDGYGQPGRKRVRGLTVSGQSHRRDIDSARAGKPAQCVQCHLPQPDGWAQPGPARRQADSARAHTNARDTGVQLPQQVTAFNVYSQEQAIFNANKDLIAQIIASGLAAPGDTLAILGILLASGQISSPIFQNGILLFGNGLTLSGLSVSPLTVAFNLNSSDSRQLDQFQFRYG